MDKTGQTLNNMSDILKLQLQVAEIAEENKKKVAALQAKFEKVETEAYDECPVCYGSISVKNTCCMPNCDHKMCKNCYYNWLDKQEKNSCPMCRAEVFKNNDDIRDKREILQHQGNDLIGKIQNLNWDRQDLRKSIMRAHKDKDELFEDVMRLENKYEQLDDEIFDKQQIVDEIREYERHHDIWKKKRKRRLGKQIRIGREKWRINIKNVHKELLEDSWIEDEEGLKEELDPYCDEVDISELNMFELPPEFEGDENRKTMCMWTEYSGPNEGNHRPVLEADEVDEINWDNYDYIDWGADYDTDETSSMPELIDATDQELENIVLEETTFSQDEREYDRAALNVPSQLEEGEIVEPPFRFMHVSSVSRRLNFDDDISEAFRASGSVRI